MLQGLQPNASSKKFEILRAVGFLGCCGSSGLDANCLDLGKCNHLVGEEGTYWLLNLQMRITLEIWGILAQVAELGVFSFLADRLRPEAWVYYSFLSKSLIPGNNQSQNEGQFPQLNVLGQVMFTWHAESLPSCLCQSWSDCQRRDWPGAMYSDFEWKGAPLSSPTFPIITGKLWAERISNAADMDWGLRQPVFHIKGWLAYHAWNFFLFAARIDLPFGRAFSSAFGSGLRADTGRSSYPRTCKIYANVTL